MSQNSLPTDQQPQQVKKKRNLPGNPDPDAEVIALSPKALLAKHRFSCEICNKGFQRDQNLQLHRRAHNLPWELKQRDSNESKKKVYICPVPTCIHHDPSRALGDITGIKKHFFRKHGEKNWKCEKCPKAYAVESDWKAHSKICGMKDYRCECGTIFSRRDSLTTHKTFECEVLAEKAARFTATASPKFHFNRQHLPTPPPPATLFPFPPSSWAPPPQNPNPHYLMTPFPPLSATPLYHKVMTGHVSPTLDAQVTDTPWQRNDRLTRNFLGLAVEHCSGSGSGSEMELAAIVHGQPGVPRNI